MRLSNYYLFFSIGLLLVLISPNILSHGMFMDGLFYSTIARNMSIGLGDFWHPHLTLTNNPEFYGHPPLAFGIQSIFYRIFGDHFLVEKLYSLSTYVITIILIIKIWNRISEFKKATSWLVLFFWFLVPIAYWSVSNNMLEGTMMMFTTSSIYLSIIGYQNRNNFLSLVSGFILFCAFLTKGFVGLFPLSCCLWFFLLFKEYSFKDFIINLSYSLIGLTIPLLLIYLFSKEGITSLSNYIELQVIGSFKNEETVDTRFHIVRRLLMETVHIQAIIVLILIFTRKLGFKYSKWLPFILLTALSGVIPIVLSLKQSGFFLITTLPLFGIVFALLIEKRIHNWTELVNRKPNIPKIVGVSILIIGISLSIKNINTIGRNKKLLTDIFKIIKIIPENSKIGIHEKLKGNFALHGYFHRYQFISLDDENAFDHKYILMPKYIKDLPSNYKEVALTLSTYKLYTSTSDLTQ